MIAASKIRHEARYDHLGKVFAERLRRASEQPGSFTVLTSSRVVQVVCFDRGGRL